MNKKIIKSKKEVTLNSRTANKGFVYVKFSNFILDEKTLDYKINVVDYTEEIIPINEANELGEIVEVEKKILNKISSKEVIISKAEADAVEQGALAMGLFEKSGITTEDLYNLIIVAIYLTVTTDGGENGRLIYDTQPTDWEIINDLI